MKFKIFCLAASLLLGAVSGIPASATTVDVNAYAPVTPKVALSVTSTTARTALGYVGTNNTVVLHNTGTVDATVAFGGATVVATDTDFPIPAGAWVTLNAKANTYIAYKTASSTTTVAMYTGAGGNPEVTGAATTSSPAVATNTATTATNTGLVATGVGTTTDLACSTDNGTCALLALIKRTNQRITSLITALGSPFQASGTLGAGSATIGNVGIVNGANQAAVKAASTAPTATDPSVVVSISPNGVNANGPATSANSAPVVIASDQAAIAINPTPSTTTGCTAYGLQTAASTNSTSVKGSAGTLCAMNLINTATTIYYLRMYNSASAPTCSSATGFVRTWPIPPAAASGGADGIAVNLGAFGTAFSTGIGFCVTGGGSSTDNTNAATGLYINLDYK